MSSTIQRREDGTIELKITLPWETVLPVREKIIADAVSQTEIAGFRKGKAPRAMVEPSLDKAKIKEEALRKMLPESYVAAVEKQKIRPIMNPKIHVEKIDDGQDWLVHALTCEMPEVKLNAYKDAVQKITAKSKILKPGQEKPTEPPMDEIMQAVLAEAEVKVPALLVEQEVDRLLSQTLDEIKRLGLTLDQYLSSTGKNPEQLRDDYKLKAEDDIKLEFVLQQIAETEKLVVENTELDEAILKAKNPVERENLERNKYMLASILRQQKTLDFLKNL